MSVMDEDKQKEEEKKIKEYECNLNKKLDLDFMQYLKLLANCIHQINSEDDKQHVEAWCDKLLTEKRTSLTNKRMRNIFLSQLVLAINEKRISTSDVFSKSPLALSSYASSAFGLSPQKQQFGDAGRSLEKELNLSDYTNFSEDKRTYIATKSLPNGTGLMAYIGLSIGSDTPVWFDSKGNPWPEENPRVFDPSISLDGYDCIGEKKNPQDESKGSRIKNMKEFSGNVLKKINENMTSIEKNGEIPTNTDPALCRLMKILELELTKNDLGGSLQGLPPVDRYYQMLKLLGEAVVLKTQKGKSAIVNKTQGKNPKCNASDTEVDQLETSWVNAANLELDECNLNRLKGKYPHFLIIKLTEILKKERISLIKKQKAEIFSENQVLSPGMSQILNEVLIIKNESEKLEKFLREIETLKSDDEGPTNCPGNRNIKETLRVLNELRGYLECKFKISRHPCLSKLMDSLQDSTEACKTVKNRYEQKTKNLKKELNCLVNSINLSQRSTNRNTASMSVPSGRC